MGGAGVDYGDIRDIQPYIARSVVTVDTSGRDGGRRSAEGRFLGEKGSF